MGSSWLLPASDRLLSRCFARAVFLYLLHLCSASVKVYPLGPIWAPGPTRPLCSQSSYTPEPLRLLALPQGIVPKNPSALQTTEQQLCTRELARGKERGSCCLGIEVRTCVSSHVNCHWQRLLLAHHCFYRQGPLGTPVEALLLGLDLVNNPLGFSEASVCYMCTDLSFSQRLTNVF